jgi:hypothetical protein
MQVKCILKYGMRQVWSPDFVLNEFKTGGTCLLGDLRDPAGSMSGNNIRLEKQKFGRFNQGGYDIPEHTNADTLIVMGGRSSIVKWFRFHGNGPTVFQGAGECELFTYVLRLKRRFDKDLTMIVIAATGTCVVRSTCGIVRKRRIRRTGTCGCATSRRRNWATSTSGCSPGRPASNWPSDFRQLEGVAFSRNRLIEVKMSTGRGKTTVVFFSAPISTSVCR